MQTYWVTSGTAAAPNYAEARGAESRADFIHKMRIALNELNETSIWLRVMKDGFDVDAEIVSSLIAENTQLFRMWSHLYRLRSGTR